MWLGIVTSIIGSIVYSVLKKPVNLTRNYVAGELKDRDVASEEWREKIEEDLNIIKRKLDGLVRKDFLASYDFLQQAVVLLTSAFEEANGAQNDGTNATTTTTGSEMASGVLNEAIELSLAIQQLENTSNGLFVRAVECFKDARKEATRAFCNEALDLPERIMAAQLRVVSAILESLQDTKTAAATCMLFLKKLHDLPAIGETFSVYFKGGFKSKFYKEWRLENVKSILALNFAVSEFVARFSGELPDVRNWPRIHLSTRGETIHPLLLHRGVLKEIFDKEEFQLPENHVISDKAGLLFNDGRCVNSKGQFFASPVSCSQYVNIFKRSGVVKTFCDLEEGIGDIHFGGDRGWCYVVKKVLLIDRCDKVSIILALTPFICCSKLSAFDSSGNRQYTCDLNHDDNGDRSYAVNNDGDILELAGYERNYIKVRDKVNPKNIKSTLSLERSFTTVECVTNRNEIVMRAENVLVLTKEGKTKRTIKVEKVIEAVWFNHVTSKIEVLARNFEGVFTDFTRLSYYILSYGSENDEVECLHLPLKGLDCVMFCSHPAGPAVLVYPCQRQAVFM